MVAHTALSFFCISSGKLAKELSIEVKPVELLLMLFLPCDACSLKADPVALNAWSRGCGFHRHCCSGLQESDVHQDYTQEFAQIEKIG